MFTRQKKNYRIFIYAALIITLCILVVALMWPKTAEPDAVDQANAQTDAEGENPIDADNKDRETDVSDNNVSGSNEEDEPDEQRENEDTHDKSVVGEKQDTYYVVKRNGDKISVFFSDENGEEIELETTDIIYELLTPEDQKNFDEGIKAESQEQLSSILQDFES